jgi:hypothetical protein
MNRGFRGWARPRHKVFVGAPQTIDTTNGNTFAHGFGRVPGEVAVRLVCTAANNGYLVGEEIPIESLWANDGNNDDGAPYRVLRYNAQNIFVKLSTGTLAFFNPSAAVTSANAVSITLTQWKVLVRCADIERLI